MSNKETPESKLLSRLHLHFLQEVVNVYVCPYCGLEIEIGDIMPYVYDVTTVLCPGCDSFSRLEKLDQKFTGNFAVEKT